MGYTALDAGTTETDDNVAIGYNAMGGAIGTEAVNDCVAVGADALSGALDSTDGADEASGTVAIGKSALAALTTGAGNVAMGYGALATNTTADDNIAIGYNALNTHNGAYNIAIGFNAMYDTDAGGNSEVSSHNIFMGTYAGAGTWGNTAVSSFNIGIGSNVMDAAMDGAAYNTSVGYLSSSAITTGGGNCVLGASSGLLITEGEKNTCIGYESGDVITDVDNNTIIGAASDASASGGINQTVIGYNTTGVADDSVTLGNASVHSVYMNQDGSAHVRAGQMTISDTAILKTTGYTGLSNTHTKTLGATDENDDFFGIDNVFTWDDDGGLDSHFGAFFGIRSSATITDSVGESVNLAGIHSTTKLTIGDINNVYGDFNLVDIDGGTVDSDIYGQFIDVDIESGCTLGNDVLGIQCNVDADTNPAGGVNGLYLRMLTNADKFVDMFDGTASTDRFEILISGVVNAEGTINASQSMDYAEYFESKDGKEIAVGTTVKLDGNQIVSCSDGDTPLGVIRPKSGNQIVGGGQVFHWKDQFDKDDYGANIWEDYSLVKWSEEITFEEYTKRGKDDTGGAMGGILTDSKVDGSKAIEAKDAELDDDGNELEPAVKAVDAVPDKYYRKHKYHSDRMPEGTTAPADAEVIEVAKQRQKLNPDYDASKTYNPREGRDEWHVVGLLGQIPITKGQPTGSWIKMKDVSDTVEMYFVK